MPLIEYGHTDFGENKVQEANEKWSDIKINNNDNYKKALSFNRNLLMENFIIPNRLKFPLFRNILENYFF